MSLWTCSVCVTLCCDYFQDNADSRNMLKTLKNLPMTLEVLQVLCFCCFLKQ